LVVVPLFRVLRKQKTEGPRSKIIFAFNDKKQKTGTVDQAHQARALEERALQLLVCKSSIELTTHPHF